MSKPFVRFINANVPLVLHREGFVFSIFGFGLLSFIVVTDCSSVVISRIRAFEKKGVQYTHENAVQDN